MYQDEFKGLWNKHFKKIAGCNHIGNTFKNYAHRELLFNNFLKLKSTDKKFDKILIAEAAPPLNLTSLNNCEGDNCNSYFYDPIHLNDTPYFREVYKSISTFHLWGKPLCPNNKFELLQKIADDGFLVLDLYPFPIDFSKKIGKKTIRDNLIDDGIHGSFWDIEDYSILNRIKELKDLGYISKKPKACFLAPPKLGVALTDLVLTRRSCELDFDTTISTIVLGGRSSIYYKCCASNGSGNPNSNRIKDALGL
jgi:hypothetical protein